MIRGGRERELKEGDRPVGGSKKKCFYFTDENFFFLLQVTINELACDLAIANLTSLIGSIYVESV